MNTPHRQVKCNVPFCNECWQVIKTNVVGVLEVADKLAGRKSTIRKQLNLPQPKAKQ